MILLKTGNKKLRIKDCPGIKSFMGLMFDNMKKHDGALIYSNNIWMPFVKNSLDLFFLDKDFVLIDVMKAVPLTLNPGTWKTYKCKGAKYCLETKSGAMTARKGSRIPIKKDIM